MIDPSNALQSFEQLFLTGKIQLEPGHLDTNLYSYVDEMDGTTRCTLVGLEGKTVTAFVVFAQDGTSKFSQCAAEQTISKTPVAVTDIISGLPAPQYVRKIRTTTGS